MLRNNKSKTFSFSPYKNILHVHFKLTCLLSRLFHSEQISRFHQCQQPILWDVDTLRKNKFERHSTTYSNTYCLFEEGEVVNNQAR